MHHHSSRCCHPPSPPSPHHNRHHYHHPCRTPKLPPSPWQPAPPLANHRCLHNHAATTTAAPPLPPSPRHHHHHPTIHVTATTTAATAAAFPAAATVAAVAGCRWQISHQRHGGAYTNPDLLLTFPCMGLAAAKPPSWWRSDDGTATTASPCGVGL
nr:hypothetical protein [Tanacetum cinerariifolium]